MSFGALEELRRAVVDDPELRDRLLASSDPDTFTRTVLAVASTLDIGLMEADVAAGLADAERFQQERWV